MTSSTRTKHATRLRYAPDINTSVLEIHHLYKSENANRDYPRRRGWNRATCGLRRGCDKQKPPSLYEHNTSYPYYYTRHGVQ